MGALQAKQLSAIRFQDKIAATAGTRLQNQHRHNLQLLV
jgi:hypothetical protein